MSSNRRARETHLSRGSLRRHRHTVLSKMSQERDQGDWLWETTPQGSLSPSPSPQVVSRGCETRELALPRDGQGRLGFEVDAEGFITHVERFTFAETTGLRPGARLLRVCGQTLPKLGPEAAAQMLRSAPKVCVTVLPPDESGRPRRSGHPGCGVCVGGLGS